MKTIYDALTWHEVRVTGHAAAQYIPLKCGEAGTTGTRATLIAGTHGDEGPWSALAIKLLCQHPPAKLKGRLRVIFTANALAAEVERRNSWIDSPNSIDLHTPAELQVFTAPYEQTAMMLLRPQICTVEGSALVYVIARPV